MKRTTAYIALGSNVGNRGMILRQAMDLLRRREGVVLKRVSALLETEPVGGPPDQPNYLNGAVEVETTLSPDELLVAMMEIETTLGRDRRTEQRWGPRTCDLDLLLMDDVVLETDRLTLPHPRMHLRKFVLEPLAMIAPQARHPLLFQTVEEMLATLRDRLQ
jgi:2-amino-4-hydroxy-6-hydroxymethyldihydropteridine diphosphokinase